MFVLFARAGICFLGLVNLSQGRLVVVVGGSRGAWLACGHCERDIIIKHR